jgi:hypothetical protein
MPILWTDPTDDQDQPQDANRLQRRVYVACFVLIVLWAVFRFLPVP